MSSFYFRSLLSFCLPLSSFFLLVTLFVVLFFFQSFITSSYVIFLSLFTNFPLIFAFFPLFLPFLSPLLCSLLCLSFQQTALSILYWNSYCNVLYKCTPSWRIQYCVPPEGVTPFKRLHLVQKLIPPLQHHCILACQYIRM
jgi:hypothetical protein